MDVTIPPTPVGANTASFGQTISTLVTQQLMDDVQRLGLWRVALRFLVLTAVFAVILLGLVYSVFNALAEYLYEHGTFLIPILCLGTIAYCIVFVFEKVTRMSDVSSLEVGKLCVRITGISGAGALWLLCFTTIFFAYRDLVSLEIKGQPARSLPAVGSLFETTPPRAVEQTEAEQQPVSKGLALESKETQQTEAAQAEDEPSDSALGPFIEQPAPASSEPASTTPSPQAAIGKSSEVR